MADTAVAITAGTGTNIDTRTEATNGNHRQVIVLGDPSTNAGVAPVDATNGLSVTLTTALPAGTAAIGKLAANSGVDIGDVDITSSALPTGASTSAKQDTGNTSIASIDTKTPALGQALAAASVPVVLTAAQVTTLTPPAAITGFATEAKQPALGTAGTASADVISVQGVASMTALKVDGSAVTQPVSGTFYQATQPVSIATAPALVASTALIGKVSIDQVTANANEVVTKTGSVTTATLAAETTKVIGTVNQGTSPWVVTGGGGGTEYVVNAVVPTDPTGATFTMERDDALSALAEAEGDWTNPRSNANGALWVKQDGTVIVDGSGVTQPVSLTSTTVTGTVAVTQSGTWDEVGINDSGNSITVDYATTGSGTATGALRVELPTNGTGTVGLNAGTNAIGKLAANSGVDIGDVDILSIAAGDNNIGNVDIVSGTVTTVTTLTGGGIAHDSADSGNPHKIGYKAYSPDGTTPGTAVAEGDRTDAKADLDGRQFVNGEHPRWWSYHEDSSSALTDATVQASPGAGFQIVVTEIMVSTGAATALNVFFEEGSTKVLGPWYLEAVAGRGLFWKGNKHITANTALTITTSAAIAHGIDIQGYIQAV